LPLGSYIQESGLLLQGGSGLILQRDGGGRWRLDAPRKAERLIGRRVTIQGKRSGFDLLDVHEVYLEGNKPAQLIMHSWQFGAGVLSALGLLALIIVMLSGQ
jgi:Protein of unknown function (DUF5818)